MENKFHTQTVFRISFNSPCLKWGFGIGAGIQNKKQRNKGRIIEYA